MPLEHLCSTNNILFWKPIYVLLFLRVSDTMLTFCLVNLLKIQKNLLILYNGMMRMKNKKCQDDNKHIIHKMYTSNEN